MEVEPSPSLFSMKEEAAETPSIAMSVESVTTPSGGLEAVCELSTDQVLQLQKVCPRAAFFVFFFPVFF